MAHLTYEEAKKFVVKGLWILAIVTLAEVAISLLSKGHLISGLEKFTVIHYIAGAVIAIFSLYKAYFIVYNFMHLGSEVRGLRWSVLLPCILLIWAIIAFLDEGNAWGKRRQQIKEKNELRAEPTGFIQTDDSLYRELI
ncbi:MAG: hypothetical protein D6714_02240 [Bacteroidetes bacterium]|nr:MAG: hypothetical protein D6714_02240 [Bacteroidota bacterium]